ncbi:MAG: choice-of-anchor D domain-containing protein [Myxococcota bacterium]
MGFVAGLLLAAAACDSAGSDGPQLSYADGSSTDIGPTEDTSSSDVDVRDDTSTAADVPSPDVEGGGDGAAPDGTADAGDGGPDAGPDTTCTPDCDGRECGDDGCGGSCGTCPGAAPVCEDHLCVAEAAPDIVVSPPSIDFGTAAPGSTVTRNLQILDSGTADLEVTGFELSGAPSFAFVVGEEKWSTTGAGSIGVTFDEPLLVAPGSSVAVAVQFTPQGPGEVEGQLVLHSTDAEDPQTTVSLSGEGEQGPLPDAIHVELTWDTPGDPDQTDHGPMAGSDLNLHFAHPSATGVDIDSDDVPDGWFDDTFDCFWFNNSPEWGSDDENADDDPSLDHDDTDGLGPENIVLPVPEDGLTYRVGVHYWNDHGYGPSNATVRVYIYSSLVFELEDVELVNHDFWEVATIDWPSGEVELVTGDGGEYAIFPDVQPSFF